MNLGYGNEPSAQAVRVQSSSLELDHVVLLWRLELGKLLENLDLRLRLQERKVSDIWPGARGMVRT